MLFRQGEVLSMSRRKQCIKQPLTDGKDTGKKEQTSIIDICLDGEIGRHEGLKIP